MMPMEFSTIQTKLCRDHFQCYQSVEQFIDDVKLVFVNCSLYNHVSDRPTGGATRWPAWRGLQLTYSLLYTAVRLELVT